MACVSCKEKGDGQKPKESSVSENTNVEFKSLETNFMKWWTYHENNISLMSDFVALNEQSKEITKDEFLKTLISSDYIPLKLNSADNSITYKLFKLTESADKSIRGTIKNTSKKVYKHFQMEGTDFPKFSFTDLNGEEYDNNSTSGKTLVIKCWFINCKPCIAEFPELNQLVEEYENREDINFIALAIDSKEDLDKFLSKKPLKYVTIPNQEEFMEQTLGVKDYPTHFVIDENGKIKKVMIKSSELISYLKESQKSNPKDLKSAAPPPPPSSN